MKRSLHSSNLDPQDPLLNGLLSRLRSARWRVLETHRARGSEQMRIDAELLREASEAGSLPTLRFYTWSPPAVSLGRFQDEGEVDASYLRARGWDLVRRPTGGRAVLHQFELTYAIVLPPAVADGAGVRVLHRALLEPIRRGLQGWLGSELAAHRHRPAGPGGANCFATMTEADLGGAGGKLVGSAQARSGGAILQHGSILLDAEPEAWAAALGQPAHLATASGWLGYRPDSILAEAAIKQGFDEIGIRLADCAAIPIAALPRFGKAQGGPSCSQC